MYKLLLSWRYLRSRYIALASIISVTLGVATLIVVNSVMSGFSEEMHKRLHGILSDIVVESVGLDGLPNPDWHMAEIRKTAGPDVEGMTAIVRVPAMLHFQVHGRWVAQQVLLIGIDETTYGRVGDFSKYLLHPENKRQLSFLLREHGYDSRMPPGGWRYRRARYAYEQMLQAPAATRPADEPGGEAAARGGPRQIYPPRETPAGVEGARVETARVEDVGGEPVELDLGKLARLGQAFRQAEETRHAGPPALARDAKALTDPVTGEHRQDPFAARRPAEKVFDETKDQHIGLVLGLAIASTKHRDPKTGEVLDYFLARPGDDVQVALPTIGAPPKLVSASFTVVDLYESKMSEYDSSFAFVPLTALQDLRGMIDPASGVTAVTSIQIKLREGANLNVVRDRLRARFPPEMFPYRIQTWMDLQGPLLAAVRLETTILNILLFLIIAVAGFGILATFFMIVVEKTRDIGILKSLGAPSGGVMSIFLTYGLSLGLVGAGVGTVAGVLFVIHINDIAALIEWTTGQEVFDQTIYYFQEIPTILDPFTIAWVAAGAVLIAVLASVLPALRAAGMHPVEALRYE